MECLRPHSSEKLAETLGGAARNGNHITIGGAFTKDRMGGVAAAADVVISTSALSGIVEYEPRDLTISVEAGLRFAELSRRIAEDGLMLPLDPPFFEKATVGGVVATNMSGPRRRLYGTARDVVIGIKFATVEGKLIQSGGMVVKNAAGLDLAKLMVGSFGTLAAIAVVNFRLTPIPPFTRTFLLSFVSAEDAFDACAALVRSVLQPAAIDLLNPAAARLFDRQGYLLAVQAGGNRAVIERYQRELAKAETVGGEDEKLFWESVREFTPHFLAQEPDGSVVRISTTLSGLNIIIRQATVPVIARAGSGVCYGCFSDCASAGAWMREAANRGGSAVLEFRPEAGCPEVPPWPAVGTDFGVLKTIKKLFDPQGLLNKGRLYGRL